MPKTINKIPSDLDLVATIKNKECSTSLIELINRHEHLFHKVCHRFNKAFIFKGIHLDDVLADKDYIIYRAAKKFKLQKKNKVSSWIGKYTYYYCLNLLNRGGYKNETALPENNLTLDQETSNLIDLPKFSFDIVAEVLNEIPDKRVLKVFEYRYGDEKKMSWNEISRRLGCYLVTVKSLHNKGLSHLKNKLKGAGDFVLS